MWQNQSSTSHTNRSVRVGRERRFLGTEGSTWSAHNCRPEATLHSETCGCLLVHIDTNMNVYPHQKRRNTDLLLINSVVIVHPLPALWHTRHRNEHCRHRTSSQGTCSLTGKSDSKHIEMHQQYRSRKEKDCFGY